LAKGSEPGRKVIARNRRASHDYFLEERVEAGLVLQGTEVKSLREGRANINEAYASEQGGELYLVNATIPEYRAGNIFNHEPQRARKLLLHRREMGKLIGAMRRSGETVIPLSLYFNPRGIAKVARPSRSATGGARRSAWFARRHDLRRCLCDQPRLNDGFARTNRSRALYSRPRAAPNRVVGYDGLVAPSRPPEPT
jgi:SsrA-binding protein